MLDAYPLNRYHGGGRRGRGCINSLPIPGLSSVVEFDYERAKSETTPNEKGTFHDRFKDRSRTVVPAADPDEG